jgi:arsenate reductase (thioredoxin)
MRPNWFAQPADSLPQFLTDPSVYDRNVAGQNRCMIKPNVLFLCTGNSCRSIMAEALLRDIAGDRFNAFSAGTNPKGVNPLTEQVLGEAGIDTADLRSKHVSEFLGKMMVHYAIVVCHDASENCPRIFPGMRERMFWPFEDPPAFQGSEEERLAKFREVRDQIADRIRTWVAGMPEEA